MSYESSNHSEENLTSSRKTPQRCEKSEKRNDVSFEHSNYSQEDLNLSEETMKKEMNRQEEREFPNAFYGLITKQLLKDPVVIPDGDSYERSAIEARGGFLAEKIYENRALASIIEERIQLSEKLVRASIHSRRMSFMQLMEKPSVPSTSYRPLHDSFYCPITFFLMHEPVIDPEGNTFERAAIINWIRANKTSPITRTALTEEDLYPNNAITSLMEIEKGRGEDSIHPCVRKWKDEDPPVIEDIETGEGETSLPTTHAQIEERRRAEIQDELHIGGFGALIFSLIALSLGFNLSIVFPILALCGICTSSVQNRSERDNRPYY
mmetsp:Transcript_41504/g.81362  ORF Transcript_41504/g.81362 Transcript_41504/m.81362 type:complete len:323 (-) Transcript_41504:81-1049(-)